MPSRCVAAGCNTSSESVSVYKFPKQETLLKQWTKQVQRTRANWVPTASSTLCSEHFEADCFEETPQYKKVLKPNAIPTIFKRSLVGTSETETPSTSTGSSQPNASAVTNEAYLMSSYNKTEWMSQLSPEKLEQLVGDVRKRRKELEAKFKAREASITKSHEEKQLKAVEPLTESRRKHLKRRRT
uniref:THAP-type domain-containing protein n=1 Tax=Oryzias latipes TaxID=8090 RepID=A0A3P9HT73_ORYLA